MRSSLALLALAGSVLLPTAASAAGLTDRVISNYFAAFDREDYTRVLDATMGQARRVTASLVDELQREQARHHIRLDIATRKIEIDRPCIGPIRVRFDIDVFACFAFFRKKVKTIHGEAMFSVDDAGRIVDISGDLGA